MSSSSARVLLLTLGLATFTRLSAEDPASNPAAVPTPPPNPPATTEVVTPPAAAVLPSPSTGVLATTPNGAPGAPELTLEECIKLVLERNFSLRAASFTALNAKEQLIITKAGFDPTFTATGTASHVQGVTSISDSIGTVTSSNFRQDQGDLRVGVNQTIETGANFNVTTGLLRTNNSPPTSSINPAYNSDISLSVLQPLLRGAGLSVNRAAIESARIGVTIANLNFKGSVLQAVRDTEAAYYSLAFARAQLAVKQSSLELAQKLFDENKVRKNTGVATDLDVLTAEVGVATAQNGVVLAQQQVRNSEDVLLALTGLTSFDQAPGPLKFTPYTDPAPLIADSFRLARDLQPNYVATLEVIKQLELAVKIANNGKLPTLNLGGALGYNGLDRTTGSSYDNLRTGDNYNWQVDLSLSVPWGLRADRARARTALNNLHQEQATLQQVEQNLLVQVRADVLAVSTNIESVQISTKATELAAKQYELQKAKFDAGLATSRDVLQSQTDLETARVNDLQARVNLRIAVANLHQLDGSSLDRYHVIVPQ